MDNRVTIVDIDIPFGKIVGIILKWSLASIPAMLLIWGIFLLITTIFGAIFGAVLGG
ncbi:MAG: hypothetical protein P8046_15710 [Anaerolineales bacterium]